MKQVYLDHAATTPTHPDVVTAMLPYFTDLFGNPSSIHKFGQATKGAVEEGRLKVAKLLNAMPEEIVFTSGGTESDNFAIEGVAYAKKSKGNHIITSKIEHHAVSECCEFLGKQGFEITYLPVDSNGFVSPDDLRNAIKETTILASIMHANNEMGTIQPIKELAEVAHSKKVLFHTDAVQTAGHIPIDVKDLGIDLLSLSGHKFYGPKGIGALYIKKGTRLVQLLHGGGQERGRRASTENVPGIVGIGVASEIAMKEMEKDLEIQTRLRDKLIDGILSKIPDSRLNGDRTKRLPNNVNLSIRYIEGESILLSLDFLGIAASSGSACTSGSLEPSHVMLALGLSHEQAHGSLRLSLGRMTQEADIDYVLDNLPKIVEKLRMMSPLYQKKG